MIMWNKEELRETLDRLRSEGRQAVITVWQCGDYKIWSDLDAKYAQADPGFLVNIPLSHEIVER